MCFLFAGCGSSSFSANLMTIGEGMPQEKVRELLGNPDYRRFDRDLEEWEYVKGYSQEENKIILIRFIDKKVTGMDTFLRRIPRGRGEIPTNK